MTERTIQSGNHPIVIVKAGGSIAVKGQPGDTVTARTGDAWGLSMDKRSEAQIARARAAVGNTVLFDFRLRLPTREEKKLPEDAIEVQFGGSGEVWVPEGSTLKVYAGKDIDVRGVNGRVDAYSGLALTLQDVYCLGHASAGGSMTLDCQTMMGGDREFKAGRNLRFRVADLASARIRVHDIGGYWEARIGSGERSVSLKCGGDVILVTDQKVEALPPDYVLGRIEKPA